MPKQQRKEYNDDSLTMLKGADRVRKKPSVIFGSDGLEGCEHAVFEIISNGVDEAREGFGNKITVTRFADGSVEVLDCGRGCPVEFNEREQRFNWELAFCELWAGGKYDNAGEGSYTYSLGLNGLGLASTQMAAEWMDAEIRKDGFRYTLRFEKGYNVGGLQKEPYPKKDTGSRFRWKPDLEVFTEIDIQPEYYRDTLKRQSVVNAGVHFYFRNETAPGKFEQEEFFYANGIVDYVAEQAGDDRLTDIQFWNAQRRGRDRADKPEYPLKITSALCFSRTKQWKEYYHNSSFLEHGGAPDKAVQSAFVGHMDAWLKNGRYNKSDPKVKFQDIADCMLLVISSFSTDPSYENQTKKAITNKFIQEAMTEFFRHQLEVYFLENPLEADKIAEQVLINLRSRVRAEQTRVNLKSSLQKGNSLTNRVQKFVDCRSRDVSQRELYIVEGDSALGACKQARDSDFQAVIPLRGKILNCLKSDYGKIFKNEIILDLIRVLGCGVEARGGKAAKEFSSFDLGQLSWNKVIICTDADVDGFQIRTLILTMLYVLMPTLIEAGKVFIAESPLYEINAGGETWFAYTEQEKAQALKALEGKKFVMQRSKGLGENDADMMNLTTMNPATRRLVQVCPTEAKATADMFDLMEGNNLMGRKEHIALHGHEYLELADVS